MELKATQFKISRMGLLVKTSTPLHIFPTPVHFNFYFNIIILRTSSLRFNGLQYIERII
jgi:hypothetical protein